MGGRRMKMWRVSELTATRPSKTSGGREMGYEKRFDLLSEAEGYWYAMSQFRHDRERCKRYLYGDQWSDMIEVDGRMMLESDYIKKQGNVPLKNNLIRRLVKNVMGAYRGQNNEPICTARDRDEQKIGETFTVMLQCNWQRNKMKEMNARCFEEFLISGFVVQKKWYGWNSVPRGGLDCWTDYVQPNNYFVDNNMRDFRGGDETCVGEIHDISFTHLCNRFAKSPEEKQRLMKIYNVRNMNEANLSLYLTKFGYSKPKDYAFYFSSDPSRCRVIEIWRKEAVERYRCHDVMNGEMYVIETSDVKEVEAINRKRIEQGLAAGMPEEEIPLIRYEWFVDERWMYYYLAPTGEVLGKGESPYSHGGHPYVFKAYPYIDGEIHSFVSDVIDQQRYVNRLITMYDWIMKASAKGVLVFPEECLSDMMSLDEIADEWSKFNGVIVCKTKENAKIPTQISQNATNIGIVDLLNMQLKFMEDISGVNGAMQGRQDYSGMSGSLYSQQAANGQTSLVDLLETFNDFIVDSAWKDVKNMQQYYDSNRRFAISGKRAAVEYDADVMSEIELDLSVTESTTTPVYRQAANQFLMEIWKQGQISLESMLEVGEFPFADELLSKIKAQGDALQKGEQGGVLPRVNGNGQELMTA
ncbi:MAG: hypothetical protein ACI4T5_02520 [Prevotella sp.]